jgi:hypothetical protein
MLLFRALNEALPGFFFKLIATGLRLLLVSLLGRLLPFLALAAVF